MPDTVTFEGGPAHGLVAVFYQADLINIPEGMPDGGIGAFHVHFIENATNGPILHRYHLTTGLDGERLAVHESLWHSAVSGQ